MYAGQTEVTGSKAGSATHVSTMISDAANKWSKKSAGKTKRLKGGQKKTRSKRSRARKRAKQEPLSQKRSLSPELKNSPGGKALVEYFSHKEEDPNYFIVRAKQCFESYVKFCKCPLMQEGERVKPLSARAFSMMAQDYVRPFKRGGFHWYEVPHVEQEQSEARAKAA